MAEERKQPSAEKLKALQNAMAKIDKDFGKGAIMRLGEDKIEDVFLTITNRNYNVSKTEEYIKELSEKRKSKGVSNNRKIGINTIKEAYELCKKSGIDSDMQVTDYQNNVKIVIRMKK